MLTTLVLVLIAVLSVPALSRVLPEAQPRPVPLPVRSRRRR
ncbi:hypothetical protein [Deinococcus pimensis]|nr:hypothetical protein [Deinococcus pimensis]